ncbi:hypothetical protein EVG20_g7589 [Dentipellis fragilis]|uniref:carnosine N-methyltransferase n=1 Tax=Dentipellis fragilis TaxID=205917 RepID=A0A4Y9YGF2_9AGAM|nr:hypothetical protein EVG20_g7589 [Dentipellis fragilis]
MAPGFCEDDIEAEQVHFNNVVATFKHYAPYSLAGNNRRRKDLYTLSREDQALLEGVGYKAKLEAVDRAITANAAFLSRIVAEPEIFGHAVDEEIVNASEDTTGGPSHSHSHTHQHDHGHRHSHSHEHGAYGHGHSHSVPNKPYRPSDFDMDKLRSTLKQFVRDWSEEVGERLYPSLFLPASDGPGSHARGKEEREESYRPLKEALVAHFADIPPGERHNFRVLVPGAGLGRLAFDVAQLGFSCQGNEFSHYMLLSSFFILNRTTAVHEHVIYPYVHSFSNLPNRVSLLKPITLPDVLPSNLPPEVNFSLVAGDFEEIYGMQDETAADEPQAGHWDAILTCFFIDTAKNIVNYLRIMHKILAPGGVWINLGPLLWHFENNSSNDPSIELDLEEVKALARQIGFDIKEERTIDTTYVNHKDGLLGYVYHAAFWTATKRETLQALKAIDGSAYLYNSNKRCVRISSVRTNRAPRGSDMLRWTHQSPAITWNLEIAADNVQPALRHALLPATRQGHKDLPRALSSALAQPPADTTKKATTRPRRSDLMRSIHFRVGTRDDQGRRL